MIPPRGKANCQKTTGRPDAEDCLGMIEEPSDRSKDGGGGTRLGEERQTANIKVLSYVPEPKDLTFLDGGWAVGWSQWTASVMASTGAAPTQVRGTVLGVLKKLPDGSWKRFRGMGLLSRD